MSKRRTRFTVVGVAALLAATVALIHLCYPLPYVYSVLVYQDADFSDIHRFPARKIAASASPIEFPQSIDPAVAVVVEQHPEIDDFETFLRETETSAFLVVRDGRLVEERYLGGHHLDSFQNTFSVSKSITSALVGLAVRDGKVHLGDPITRHLPELKERDERFADIIVADLLDMRSGIRYSGEVQFPFVNSDDPLIYYHPDLESVVLERTTIASPPGAFQYNNYNPPLLGLILRRVTAMHVSEYLERELWQPMGAIRAAGWTTDAHGLERMESGFHARARDLARFGQLYLEGGVAGDRRILPEDWVIESTDVPTDEVLERYDGRRWEYRFGWWIVRRPDDRSDFCAIGRYGQFIYVSPRYDVVIVRNGPGRGSWGDRDWTELFYFIAARL